MNTKHILSPEEYLIETKKRFMKFVSIPENLNDCWEWTGYKPSNGYGHFGINGRVFGAHRISFMLFIGEIPNNMLVCHSCDNPSCVNPHHLFLGTDKDNTQDMIKKNRRSHHTGATGENNGFHKLTEQKVYKIREMLEQGYTQQEIAEIFEVTPENIRSIRIGKTWSWLK